LLLYFLRMIFVLILKITVMLFGVGKDLYKSQFKRVFFTDLILIFIEGYMEFCIAGYLQHGNSSVIRDYSGEKVSSYLGNFSIIVSIVLIPLGFIYMLSRSTAEIESKKFRDRYGGFYEGIKTYSKAALAYFLTFCLRRILFLGIAFKAYGVATLQFQMLYMLNLASTIYIGLVAPKKYWLMNYIEMVNEGIFQMATIHLIIFSDYV